MDDWRESILANGSTEDNARQRWVRAKSILLDDCGYIPYIDEQGEKFDFHSLRVQCASSLARAGVHVKVMQERLRHSDSKLTLDIYSRLSQSEQDAAAVEALPRLALGA